MEISQEDVVVFDNPFDFFALPILYQEEYLLKADFDSIRNLCKAAALSKDPGAVSFFEGLCNNYVFWKRKTRQDFPRDYTRTMRDDPLAKKTRKVEFWRGVYGNLIRVTGQRMIAAARIGDDREVIRLLNLGADINAKDGAGYTALMYASERGYNPVVQVLLRNGADPNIRTRYRWTALMQASSEGHPETVRNLLDGGADPNLQNKDDETALMQAVYENHEDVVRELLRAEVDLEIQDNAGKTALDIAVERGYSVVEEMIREKMTE